MPAISDAFTVVQNQTLYAGMAAPALPLPAWAASAEINKPLVIPNSAGAGGAPMHIWGGYAVRQDTGELFAALNGGHGDSYDNRVTSFPLLADSPAWVLRNAPTPVGQLVQNAGYYADGKPSSRHVYDFCHYVPQVNRIMQAGWRGGWPQAWTGGDTVGFNPDTNEWDPPGTWVSTDGNAGAGFDPSRGNIWTNSFQRLVTTTNTISKPFNQTIQARFPTIYDPVRDQMFNMQWGDAFGSGTTLNASKWKADGTATNVAVTFNSSAAYTQFVTDRLADNGINQVAYSGMTYDVINDCFYWYNGLGSQAGRVYIVRPNNTTVWNMEILAWASGSPVLPTVPSSGIDGRIKYIEKLKGFIICPTGNGDIYFVKTSP